ncbi:MAG: cyclic nucleotide-binding domain-containing protein [Pseudomonadota bacterium]
MFIKESELFKGIASHIIDEVAGLGTEEVFPAGHVLFQKGYSADFLYILEEGEVDITIEGQKRLSFSVNQPANVFGWSALVEPNQYTATAECVKESKVIKLDGDRLMRIFEKHPSEGLKVMKRLAGVIATRLVNSYEEVIGSKA